jgi:hypothetical protein
MRRASQKQPISSYEQKFIVCSTHVETWLKRMILVLLTLLIIVQSMLLIPEIRRILSRIDSVEGVPYSIYSLTGDSKSGGK